MSYGVRTQHQNEGTYNMYVLGAYIELPCDYILHHAQFHGMCACTCITQQAGEGDNMAGLLSCSPYDKSMCVCVCVCVYVCVYTRNYSIDLKISLRLKLEFQRIMHNSLCTQSMHIEYLLCTLTTSKLILSFFVCELCHSQQLHPPIRLYYGLAVASPYSRDGPISR